MRQAYGQLIEDLDVSITVFDREGRVQAESRGAVAERDHLGLTMSEEGRFSPPLEMIADSGAPLTLDDAPLARTLRTGQAVHGEVVGLRAIDGTTVWNAVTSSPIVDPATGEFSGVLVTALDVTELRETKDALRGSEQWFLLLAEHSTDLVYRYLIGEPSRFDYVNPAFTRVLGYSLEELYADPELGVQIIHEDDRGQLLSQAQAGSGPVVGKVLRMVHRDGHIVWTEHQTVPVRDASGTVVVLEGIARDITALRAKEADLNYRALHDALTGLPNRVLFIDRLERALARTRRHPGYLAVLYLDVDRFKTVNDNLGHEAGDRLLQVMAQRLNETVRPSDSVARLGGDEFAAILPDLADPNEAAQIAKRLLEATAEPVDLAGAERVVTMSIGIGIAGAGFDNRGREDAGAIEADGDGDGTMGVAELLRRADVAMYQAKSAGRARVESYDTLPFGS